MEILLCRIYISAKFSFETLIDDVVMTGHCRGIRDVVLAELKKMMLATMSLDLVSIIIVLYITHVSRILV